jgi:hypothetical protein
MYCNGIVPDVCKEKKDIRIFPLRDLSSLNG